MTLDAGGDNLLQVSSAPPADLVGQVLLEKFRVVRRLGQGGMAEVFEVEHMLTGHRRALKIVTAAQLRRPLQYQRLIREARIAGKLKTPHVVETYDAGTLPDGSAYVLMELLHGRSLIDVIQANGKLPLDRVCSILIPVCEGLQVAHLAGIVHRDLKPENIFVADTDTGGEIVKILDFGISKFLDPMEDEPSRLTMEGTILGTPFYMAPEQTTGHEVDGRVDVYALGVILYEATCGVIPFDGDTIGEVFQRIQSGDCLALHRRVPEIDPEFERIVARAMNSDRALRYADVEELRKDLVAFAASPGAKSSLAAPKLTEEQLRNAASPTRTDESLHHVSSEPPGGPATAGFMRHAPSSESAQSSEEPADHSHPNRDSENGYSFETAALPTSIRPPLRKWFIPSLAVASIAAAAVLYLFTSAENPTTRSLPAREDLAHDLASVPRQTEGAHNAEIARTTNDLRATDSTMFPAAPMSVDAGVAHVFEPAESGEQGVTRLETPQKTKSTSRRRSTLEPSPYR